MTFEYVNKHYGVSACVGRRVIAYGEPGTIVKDFGYYIGIVLDTSPHAAPERYHPLDGIEYGDVVEYEPPKLNARQYASKRNYNEYLDADSGQNFAEWLGIYVPEFEYHTMAGKSLCRMFRRGPYGARDVQGNWCSTQKAAKASYKQALRGNSNGGAV